MGKILNIVIVILVLAALVYGYIQFTSSSSTANPDSLSVGGTTAVSSDTTGDGTINAQQDDFIALLLDLKQISLDTAFLSSSVFTSLTDFSRDIPKQDVGRRNPFAPIGSVSEGGVSPSQVSAFAPSTQTQTDTSAQPSAQDRVRALIQEQDQTAGSLNGGL